MATNSQPNPSAFAFRTPELVEKSYQEAHDPGRAAQSEDNIVLGAWITAFFLPPVGFVLGTILTIRQREGHGIWSMVAATVITAVWSALVTSLI